MCPVQTCGLSTFRFGNPALPRDRDALMWGTPRALVIPISHLEYLILFLATDLYEYHATPEAFQRYHVVAATSTYARRVHKHQIRFHGERKCGAATNSQGYDYTEATQIQQVRHIYSICL